MKSRYALQQFILLIPIFVLMTLTNVIGYKIPIMDSVKGISILCGIALFGLIISKLMESVINLPFLVYVSLSGLILASPISPIQDVVVGLTSNVAFLTPTTTLGAFAGIALGKDLKDFTKMGWKYVIITLAVITGTFIGSALIAHIVMTLTGAFG